ncbi:hypothetical protein [Nocardia pseudobrasiliensis]|uniref:Uncharacterized protein n=1 Tax=Nocardia pseudobrasiliensis TaxID=45979 RepID=A0A370IAN0_9NOCA|nr:hypothetical protein [Nocardia pseudobrasiliensis]RDI67767.1 hypothetical protein DFR76_102166 [Nocardia pseudobrasiliensis]
MPTPHAKRHSVHAEPRFGTARSARHLIMLWIAFVAALGTVLVLL